VDVKIIFKKYKKIYYIDVILNKNILKNNCLYNFKYPFNFNKI